MKCSVHTSEDAVASCARCGAGLCQQCFNSSEYHVDGGHLCRNCNLGLMQAMLSDERKAMWINLLKFGFNAACIGVGVAGLVAGLSTPSSDGGGTFNAIANYCFCAGIGCLPSAWKATADTPEEKVRKAVHDGVYESSAEDAASSCLGVVFRIALTFVVGSIMAPFVLIGSLWKFFKAKSAVNRLKGEIEAFQP